MKNTDKIRCAVCDKDQNDVPIVLMVYKGQDFGICPQHLPVIIHDPQKLIGKIDGAEDFIAG